MVVNARSGRIWKSGPTTPHTQPLPGITRVRFGLFRVRSPLLTESRLFSLPAGTEMFHFPAFPPHTLCIQMRVTVHHDGWVSPFGHPRITARLAAPRGLSQPPTSFIGSWCQGIHRVLLHTYNITKEQRCSRPLCSSQTTHTNPLTTGQNPTTRRIGAVETTTSAVSDTQQCVLPNPSPPAPRSTL